MSNLMLSVMRAFAEFERSLIQERQLEGIELAKKHGIYKGRKRALDADQIVSIQDMLGADFTKTRIAEELNISRETLYQYLKSPQS